MTKTYIEDLAAWAKARKENSSRHDRYVVAFTAVKADVQAALEDGYTMKTIWEHLTAQGRLHCRYETFTHHVKRFIVFTPEAVAPAPRASAPDAATTRPEPPRISSFVFNPNPRKEDLL